MITTTLFVGDENGLRNYVKHDKRISTAKCDAAFGSEIKRRRLALNATQAEIAELVGIHTMTLSRLETAVNPLTTRMRIRIENILSALESS